MKDTIRKINELIYPDIPKDVLRAFESDKITLEDVLVALVRLSDEADIWQVDNFIHVKFNELKFLWQLTKTFTQQSSETQLTIKQIFEDGK